MSPSRQPWESPDKGPIVCETPLLPGAPACLLGILRWSRPFLSQKCSGCRPAPTRLSPSKRHRHCYGAQAEEGGLSTPCSPERPARARRGRSLPLPSGRFFPEASECDLCSRGWWPLPQNAWPGSQRETSPNYATPCLSQPPAPRAACRGGWHPGGHWVGAPQAPLPGPREAQPLVTRYWGRIWPTVRL